MKKITLSAAFILLFASLFASSGIIKDTIPANINKYTKEQFLKEYAKDETSEKMIRYYFYRSKNAKQSQYIFPALTVLSGIYLALLANEPYPGTPDDGYIFLSLLAVGEFVAALLIISIQAFINRKKYSPEKLYRQLMDYQAGNPLPKKLKRQIRYFNRK